MRGRKTAVVVRMDEAEREDLLAWLRAQKTPGGLARRARAMLLLAEGQTYAATSRQVGMAERHVRKWARRFIRDGPEGLRDRPRPGRPRVFSPHRGGARRQDGLRASP